MNWQPIKNNTYNNQIIYSNWPEFINSSGQGFNFNNLAEGQHRLIIEIDDSETASVNDGNKVVTNITFYKL